MEDIYQNKIENILKFTVLFTLHEKIKSYSPDYIIEKYDRWIGIKPINIEYYNNVEILEYEKIWGDIIDVKPQINYIIEICKLKYDSTNIESILKVFEKCIGDPNSVKSEIISGLSAPLNYKVNYIMKTNDITKIIRDLKLRDLC
jgi:hypothetical protein